MSDLAAPFDMALPSFMQHLGVLEEAGLVRTYKRGRVRTVEARTQPLRTVHRWLDRQRHVWEQRLDQLDTYLEDTLGDDDDRH